MIDYCAKFIIWLMLIIGLIFLLGYLIGFIVGHSLRIEEIKKTEDLSFNDLFIGQVKPIIISKIYALGIITAYSSTYEETDDTPFITASGTITRRGIIACPQKYPFGTVIEIEGEIFVCEDRMNQRFQKGNYFDIWFPDKQLALEFGRQQKEIIIYK